MDHNFCSEEAFYRFGECIFYHLAKDGKITPCEYEKLRDRLLDIYKPPVSRLERGLSWETRRSLK